jgi:hypothetical protein
MKMALERKRRFTLQWWRNTGKAAWRGTDRCGRLVTVAVETCATPMPRTFISGLSSGKQLSRAVEFMVKYFSIASRIVTNFLGL